MILPTHIPRKGQVMLNLNSNVFYIRNLLLITIVILLNACDGSEPEETAIQAPAVDPRFVSADAMLETYNNIITQAPRVDPHKIFSFMYTENDTQKAMLKSISSTIPYLELDQVVFERFGECLNPKDKIAPLAPDSPAAITERNGQRAIAEGIDAEGDKYTVHLVQIGERWWVSGYTLEYLPWGNRSIQEYEETSRFNTYLSQAAAKIEQQIKTGKITSVDQARNALRAEIVRQGS